MNGYKYLKYKNRTDDPYRRTGKAKYIAMIKDPLMKLYFRFFKHFKYENERYNYFYHYYNTTWRNERAVEIPITRKIYNQFKDAKIFEFGDVMKNYFELDHDVLDKYDKSFKTDVIKEDIVGFKSEKNMIWFLAFLH